jgi:hypothetical protein
LENIAMLFNRTGRRRDDSQNLAIVFWDRNGHRDDWRTA